MAPGTSLRPSVAPSDELVLASFNTHWGVDAHGVAFDVAAAAVGFDADVLVLQEVWRPHGCRAWINDVVAATGLSIVGEAALAPDDTDGRPRLLAAAPPGDPPGTLGIALLTRLTPTRTFELDLGRPRGDVMHRRPVVGAEFELGGRRLAVAGVHASHRLWGSPPQLAKLHRRLAEEPTPSVIVGDCNMWGPVLAPLLRGRRRAVRGRTFPGRRPHSQIDHIWVPDEVETQAGFVSGYLGSDHRAVQARLRLR